MTAWRTVVSRARTCFVPGCGETCVINSHSLSASFPLKVIQRKGFVYQLSPDRGCDMRRAYQNGRFIQHVSKVAVSRASVFNGFCNFHDTQEFKHIDVAELKVDDPVVVKELYLRSVSRHMAILEDNVRWVEEVNRISEHKDPQITNGETDPQLAYESDLRRYWFPLWESRNPDLVKWHWRIIPKILGVSASTLYPMAGDLVGEQWFYNNGARPLISLSIIPQGNNVTHVVFAWWYEWDELMQVFAQKLDELSEKEFLGLVNKIVFTKSDGYCISPRVWENLTRDERAAIENYSQMDCFQDRRIRLPNLIV